MAVSPLMSGRLVAFRLEDIPVEKRRRAGAALVRAASEDARLLEAVELTRAIEEPSVRVYRVPAEAWARVMG